ncbi:hypothetical protein AADH33_11850 [Psychrobacter sp. KFRI-CH2-11]|uniref:hypothetical protein n=1 Tax=Psychrobacter sp. KFRI-CH2-11 TaxID=3156079 RepID=UPI00324C5F11
MQTPTEAPQTKYRKHLAKKYLPAACSVGLMLALSGCLATEKLDYQLMRQEDAKWVADEQLTDRLIAVGKPSAPIEGVDNAIVFAGEKHSYLVQSANQDPELTAILNHVDLAHFSFKPMPTKDTPHFAIRVGESGCPSVQGCMALRLGYEKSTQQLAAGETDQLEDAGFTCHDGFAGGMTRCTKTLRRLPVTVAPAIKNSETLPYRFAQPIALTFYHYQPDTTLAEEKRLKALMPLAKAFDIITFPIQLIMIGGAN